MQKDTTTSYNIDVKQQVMQRVHTLWVVRTYGPIVAKLLLLGFVFAWSTLYVSYAHVFANLPSALTALPAFILDALARTEHVAVVLLLVLLAALGWLLRDIVRVVTFSTHQHGHA